MVRQTESVKIVLKSVVVFSWKFNTFYLEKSQILRNFVWHPKLNFFIQQKKQNDIFIPLCFFISLYPTFKKVDIICPPFKSSGSFVFLFCHTSFYFWEIVTAYPIIGDNIKPSFILVDNHTDALKIIIHNIKPLFVAASSRL